MKIWISALVGLLTLFSLSIYSLSGMGHEPFMFFSSALGFQILILGAGLTVVWAIVFCLAITFRKKLQYLWVVMVLLAIVFPVLHFKASDGYMSDLDYNIGRFEFKLKK